MRLKIYIALIFLNLIFQNASYAQGDCECEELEITMCYIPDALYCDTDVNDFACGYTVDGRHMEQYLTPKLENPQNFGPNGVVNCPMTLVPLSQEITVEYIETRKCDIIFIGNFIINPATGQINLESSAIPGLELSQIKEWSVKCPRNLVIASQAEAKTWGYTISDQNRNPNFSNGSTLGNFIFDGPFGKINTFDQGGSYQGIITNGPFTGYTSLGIDANGLPTLVIDKATNDIILGDIGIFCGGGAGAISSGPNITTENDQLTANIFALICELAGEVGKTIEVFLCPGEEYVVRSGEAVSTDAVLVDSLLTQNNCDSVITTIIKVFDDSQTLLNYEGCSGDNVALYINGNTYNELNPIGEELLQTIHGCDSLITIQLDYEPVSEEFYQDVICSHNLEGVTFGNTVFNALHPEGSVVFTAANGCDSTINVFLEVLPENKSIETYKICRGSSIEVRGKSYDAPIDDPITYPAANGCDSVIVVSVEFYPEFPQIPLSNPLQINLHKDYYVDINLRDEYSIQWSPEEIVSCTDCFEFFIQPDINYDVLFYTMTDSHGCTESDSILIEYECPVYIPNAFSPGSKKIENQSFQILTPCKELLKDYEMSVYDRWGNVVFQTNDPDSKWDGMLRSENAAAGVYVYLMKYVSFSGEKVVAGDVTLLR